MARRLLLVLISVLLGVAVLPTRAAGTYYVAPNGSGTTCTQNDPCDAPYALLNAQSGDTIRFAGGTYRIGEIRINKNYIIEAQSGATPVLKGSAVIDEWYADGDDWVTGWPHHWDPSDPDKIGSLRRGDVEMVWINNTMLTPVYSRAEVAPGTFYMDEGSDLLYIGTDPTGKTVEATRYTYSLERVWWNISGVPGPGDESGLTVRGMTFTHYAVDGFWSRVDRTLLENNRFIDNSQRGLLAYGDDNILRGNEISGNRIKGANFPYAHRILFEDNIVRNNSFEGLEGSDNRIAVKFGFTDNAVIRNNLVENNGGNGIWFDVGASNNIAVHNVVRNNRAGIHFEISDGAILAGNLLEGNEIGIAVTTSANGDIYNNTFVNNGEPLHILEYYRDDGDAQQGPGNAANTRVYNNIFSGGTSTDWPWALLTVRTGLCGSHSVIAGLDHNAYHRTTADQPRDVIRWDPQPGSGTQNASCDDQGQTPYNTLADFQAATTYEDNGMDFVGGSPFFNRGSYMLKSGSPAIGAGRPLPADVASALNWQAGVPVDLGAYQTDNGVELPTLTLIAPSGNANADYGDPTLRWSKAGAASAYHLWVGRASNYAQVAYLPDLKTGEVCGSNDCQLKLTDFDENYRLYSGDHVIWIGIDLSGQSYWYGPFNFTLNADPPTVPQLDPATGTDTATPDVNWSLPGDAAFANWFHLYIGPVNGGDHPTVSTWVSRVEACGSATATNCSYAITQVLPAGVEYQLWMESYGPGGYSTGGIDAAPSWTGPETFTVTLSGTPDVPQNITADPRNGRPQISWDDDPNAAWYHLYIGGSGQQYLQWLEGAAICDGDRCTVEPAIDWPDGSYQIWMEAWGPSGFSTGGIDAAPSWVQGPDLDLPTSSAGTPMSLNVSGTSSSNPTLTWQAGENATWHELVIAPADDSWSYSMWHLGYDIGCGDGGTCSVTDEALDGVLPAGDYVMRVRSWGPGGLTSYVEATFTYKP